MDGWLKQSTAATLKIGPFVDSTNGNDEETALTISQADVRLSKNGGNMAQKNETTSCTHDELGMYDCPVDTTDTDTLGRLDLSVHESGALIVRHTYMVLPANVWDSMFGADLLQVDAREHLGTAYATPTVAGVPEVDLTHIGGDAQSGTDLKDFADAGYDPATNKVEGVKLADTVTTLTNLPSIPANWITTAGITDGAFTAAKFAAGAFDAVWTVAARTLTAFDASFKTGYALSAAGVQAIWDALTSALTTAGSIGKLLVDNINATISSRLAGNDTGSGFTAIPWNASWDAEVQSEVADEIKLQRLDELLVADSDIDGLQPPAVGSVFHELMSKSTGSFTYDQTTDSLEAIRDKETDIETDTAEIGAAGAGLSAIPWNSAWDAEVESEVTDALNAYDPPTNAELVTEINAVQTDIAALNNLSAAQVNAEVVDALATDTYAEPTGAPAATAALSAKINYLYMALRNKLTITSSAKTFCDDSGAAEWSKTLADDGTTYTESEGV